MRSGMHTLILITLALAACSPTGQNFGANANAKSQSSSSQTDTSTSTDADNSEIGTKVYPATNVTGSYLDCSSADSEEGSSSTVVSCDVLVDVQNNQNASGLAAGTVKMNVNTALMAAFIGNTRLTVQAGGQRTFFMDIPQALANSANQLVTSGLDGVANQLSFPLQRLFAQGGGGTINSAAPVLALTTPPASAPAEYLAGTTCTRLQSGGQFVTLPSTAGDLCTAGTVEGHLSTSISVLYNGTTYNYIVTRLAEPSCTSRGGLKYCSCPQGGFLYTADDVLNTTLCVSVSNTAVGH